MIKDCLRNAPAQRPTAEQLVRALKGMKGAIEGGYGELATVDAVRQVRTMKALKSRSEDKVNELTAKDEQIQQLQLQLAVRTDIIVFLGWDNYCITLEGLPIILFCYTTGS